MNDQVRRFGPWALLFGAFVAPLITAATSITSIMVQTSPAKSVLAAPLSAGHPREPGDWRLR